ncbi:probable ribonuclease ZC3H12C [Drosophila hydei]|uniref:Probable ribonuclease ZC3H12C n=1 Tax=Drosophila hydei TaxID=7224 RepID=A0A6J1M1M7_DROHY|nr:probable ribonuclease ZC3H12C [Drosophila hydei]
MRIKMDCEVPEQQKQHQHQQQQQQQHQQQQQNANKSARKPQTSQQHQESSDDDDLSNAERKNLEFAQKLGYSEQSIHTALTRLGSEAKQNDLLAELIKLTADAPRPTVTNSNSNNNNHVPIPASSGSGSLRHIVIDGSNVALSHGNHSIFSCRGIRICVDWFRQRGHRHITAFVPNWRKELANNNITEQEILYELEQERMLVFTPSRHLDGKRVSCYDDRFILKLAVETDGIVVSNDNYRDLLLESNEFRRVIQDRLLMYSFVDDIFMPPDDPLGRSGPNLDMFLRTQSQQKMTDAQQQLCPYGKKCTYGQKCKFRHQTTQLQRLPLQVSHSAPLHSNGGQQLLSTSGSSSNNAKMAALARTKSNTIDKISQQQQQQQLCHSFNNQMELGSNSCDVEPAQQLNRHKKLQRQAPSPSFRLLAPTYSAPHQQQQQLVNKKNINGNYQHQYLTRTPSEPLTDQHQASKLSIPAHNLAHLSASDSRINEDIHHTKREEQRNMLRYHLNSLFPQHQVHAVLQLYPDETDAKTICAAILNLFPHN